MSDPGGWPELPADWTPTRTTLHLCSQMLGKLKLALDPPLPEWLHTDLRLTPYGWSTGPMPHAGRIVQGDLDVVDGVLRLRAGGRPAAVVPIGGRSVADVWQGFRAALTELQVTADLWDKPQETVDVTPFSANTADGAIDPEQAQRFHRLLSLIHPVFDQFRSPFFGRTGVQLWWGGFDYTVLLFNGRHAEPPEGSGHILRHDLDAEHLNAGFWPGDGTAPANFYAYLHPRPPGCEAAPVAPDAAGWVEGMGEWVLPYEELRRQDQPGVVLLDFLSSVYRVAVTTAGWDEAAHTYERPPARAAADE
jgi:hypothetical protein